MLAEAAVAAFAAILLALVWVAVSAVLATPDTVLIEAAFAAISPELVATFAFVASNPVEAVVALEATVALVVAKPVVKPVIAEPFAAILPALTPIAAVLPTICVADPAIAVALV